MAEARLRVTACGPLVSYQDRGRFGSMRFGVPASGPMDRLAHAVAQLALGQPAQATAIEVSLGGITLVCDAGEVTCCVAGGGFQVVHAGESAGPWCVRTLRAGDVLSIRPGRWGSWAYLAFCGELACTPWAGSTSTHTTSGLGGGALAAGASIVVHGARVEVAREGALTVPDVALPRQRARVVLGPQTAQFMPDVLAAFLREPFATTSASDRMGMRLAGPRLALRDALSIPSEPIVRGAVQVAGDGVASILLADHQTTGGYPKIATLLSADTDRVAQLRPQMPLNFEAVTPDQAIRLARADAAARQQALAAVACQPGSLADRLLRENLISGVLWGLDQADGAQTPA
ncbi:MAG: biotin-dependent carboxyltransferase family protein [Aquabacterium sp.]|nr:biotin-dependent carboxyltransferase family protein [Aquabacterium sp.]